MTRKQCEDVLVGRNSVVFSGEGGLVISDKILYKITAYYYLLLPIRKWHLFIFQD